jgi:predicted acetyltransferase
MCEIPAAPQRPAREDGIMEIEARAFEANRDMSAVARIWNETRWIDDNERHRTALSAFLSDGAEVGLMNGEAECLVHRTSGRIVYDEVPLPLCAITAVTTSHIGRKQRLASTLTARAIRHGVESGAAVAILGMFEQGFYDRLGFGTGSPVGIASFDPASLRVGHIPYRTPERLTSDDSVEMMTALRNRLPHHGMVSLDAPRLMEAELGFAENQFSLGYRDGGRLTHFLAGSLKEENGPFAINVMSYETGEQLMELLRLLRELGDQIHTVRMAEPPQVQIQALIDTPMRQRSRSLKTDHETVTRALTWWQLRVLDVPTVVAARQWPGDPFEFDLVVTDPIGEFVDDGWSGVGGPYAVSVGRSSSARPAEPSGRALLRCSVAAFSRLWFGVRSASSLVLTDDFEAPPELTAQLDRALTLPVPTPGLGF